ncbi:putative GPI-anchored protein At4g28100 [Wolffia australiana]
MLCFVILVLLGVSVVDGGSTGGSFVPALPAVPAEPMRGCQLDLSDEFFGGVAEACGQGPDRARCCPVLAAWLFAAHARSALVARPPPVGSEGLGSDGPVGPDDAQSCADSLQSELQRRKIALAKVNESCDLVLCYCGIRLHQIGSLSCPAGFNVSTAGGAAAPTAAVRRLERNCRNASYSGCSLCLRSLNSLGGRGGGAASETERAKKMFGRDCQLMGLTWLLSRNRTAYIATVSAVLRAMLYAPRPPRGSGAANPPPPYRCSADHDNMPLAVDSQRLEKRVTGAAAVPSAAAAISFATFLLLIGMFDYHFT